jgi:crossover junction endodeoxyribonuclease RuvC
MRVVGIDPGTATTGYGIVQEVGHGLELVAYGVVTTAPFLPLERRLLRLFDELGAILEHYQPESGAVEQLFFQRNVRTAIAVGQARGVALLVLARAGLSVGEYSPLEVKQAVTGYGAADKNQVQQMVRLLLGLPEVPKPDDAADALAVAICHLHVMRTHQWTK